MHFMIIFLGLLILTTPSWAQSSWDDLIRDVQTPVQANPDKAQKPGKPIDRSAPLEMPDMTKDAANRVGNDDARAQFVLTYKCENPDFPECLWNMDRNIEMIDIENCKELTKSYLNAIASYSQCIDRHSKKQARNIVDYFNCHANQERNCPGIFPD